MIRSFLFLTILVLSSASNSSACNEQLRVGVILGLSGEFSSWGASVRDGLELGFKDSGCGDKIVRFYEDDQFDPKMAIAAYRKLLKDKGINLVLTANSGVAHALAPLVERDKIPHITWSSYTKITEGRKYSIRNWPPGPKEGEFLAQALADRGIKKIAWFTHLHDYPLSVTSGLESRTGKFGIQTLLKEEISMEQKDFKSLLGKLKGKEVDAVGVCLIVPGVAGMFAKQLRQLGYDYSIFGCEGTELGGNFEASEGKLAGTWFSTAAIDSEFEKKFTKEFGKAGTLPGAAISYDTAKIISNSKGIGSGLIQEILDIREYHGVTGVLNGVTTEQDQYLDLPYMVLKFDEKGMQVRAD